MTDRVVVTGMGLISPVGLDTESSLRNLVSGRSGVDRITLFDASTFETGIAAEVRGFDLDNFLDADRVKGKMAERRTRFGVAAAKLALEDARLNIGGSRCAVMTAAGLGVVRMEDVTRWIDDGIFNTERFARELNRLHAETAWCPPNLVSDLIASLFGLKGCVYTITSACAASNQAIGLGARMIQRGEVDVVLAGGADSMINPMGVIGFTLLGALTTENEPPQQASKPFDRKRKGLVLGEGAGMVVLESLGHALRRDAEIYAEVAGYGTSIDAFRLTAPHSKGDGAVLAMRRALSDASWEPGDIQYINAHGTSTLLNDKIETLAIKRVFGEHAHALKISSNKSMVGHLIAACGALEFISTVDTVRRNIIPPTINYKDKDPACDLFYVPNRAIETEVHGALTNSFGFGGQNATLAISKYPQ